MSSVVITQSNYIPWRGWFAMARTSSALVFLDDVQYTRRDWRNRNLIAGPSGAKWLTIPTASAGNYKSKICEIECIDSSWIDSHLSRLDNAYMEYAHYREFRGDLRSAYEGLGNLKSLSQINQKLTSWLMTILKVNLSVYNSKDFVSSGTKTERLVGICLKLHANEYITGPAAKSYLDENLFNENSINVTWIDYSNLPAISVSTPGLQELSIIHVIATRGVDEAIRLSTFLPSLRSS